MELKKIDTLAEVKGVSCIPYIFGYGHTLAANLHFIMVSRFEFYEFPYYPEQFQMLEEPIKVEKDYIKALEKPRLGVEINRKMFEENVIN